MFDTDKYFALTKNDEEDIMNNFEVEKPILNSPYEEPAGHWHIEDGRPPEQKPGRRQAGYFYRDPKAPISSGEHETRGQNRCQT